MPGRAAPGGGWPGGIAVHVGPHAHTKVEIALVKGEFSAPLPREIDVGVHVSEVKIPVPEEEVACFLARIGGRKRDFGEPFATFAKVIHFGSFIGRPCPAHKQK